MNLNVTKVEAPIMDKGPIVDFIFKGHTFLRHISMKAIDNCLKLKRGLLLCERGVGSGERGVGIFYFNI